MAKKTGRVRTDGNVGWDERTLDKAGSLPRVDGWVNVLTGLGYAARDKVMSSGFSKSARVSREKEGLNEIYAGDDLAANIVDIPAEESVREWIELKVQTDDGDLDVETTIDIMQRLEEIGAQTAFADAQVWARLFGGSIILLGVDDGQEASEPLNFDAIRSVDYLTVLDRFDVEIDKTYSDPLQDKYGMPELYRINATRDVTSTAGSASMSYGAIVHESRTIRFDGVRTTRRRQRENQGWGDSVFERYLNVVRDYQSSQQGISHLLQTFSQAVFKMRDLAKNLTSDADGLVLKRLTMLDMARSIVRAIPLDAELEEYETKGAAVSGMADLVDRQMMRVSSAARIPVTLLFGRSPSGMNATGESDIRLFYDRIRAYQETNLRQRVEYLIMVLLNAQDGPTNGVEPEAWSFDWCPLYQESSKEKAETRKIVAETDEIYMRNGVLLADEVAASRFAGDDYSPETTINQEMRSEDEQERKRLALQQSAKALLESDREDEETYKPTAEMAAAAKRALEVRDSKPPSQRGMTPVGLARANQLIKREPLSLSTVKRMKAFFDRHEVDKQGSTWDEKGKGWQAWQGWGGDPGRSWANKIVAKANKDGRSDAAYDAPNYRPGDEEQRDAAILCATCGFANGMLCERYAFKYDNGWVCDAHTFMRETLITIDKKDKWKKRRRRKRSPRNY